jgi:uncharacterized protein with NRDE domain
MCIVSFVLEKEKFILTFNRDEAPGRPSGKPEWRDFGDRMVFCPIDKSAGGTWIGYNKSIIACLQNGGSTKHQRTPPYRKSRGLIMKELLGSQSHHNFIEKYDLEKIEPFTLSLFETSDKTLTFYIFDGKGITKKKDKLDKPAIVASSTLYDPDARRSIADEFTCLPKNPMSLLNFHKERRIGSPKNRFTSVVSTISITQFEYMENTLNCTYIDFVEGKTFRLNA